LVVWVRVWPAVTAGPGVLGVRPAWVARPVPVAPAVLRVWPVPVVMAVMVALVVRVVMPAWRDRRVLLVAPVVLVALGVVPGPAVL
ncbi:hypothetical protein OSH62_25355, partial [Mycobacterium ulcerans]